MHSSARRIAALLVVVTFLIVAAPRVASAQQGPSTRQLISGGTTTIRPAAEGSDAVQSPEFVGGEEEDAAEQPPVHRQKTRGRRKHEILTVPEVAPNPISGSTAGLNLSFNGLNFRQQRLANGGNQFSVEPPDQALCVGNGYVLESVNTVLRVFDTAGAALMGVADLNTFYGYPAAINRATLTFGPVITDPVCYFDPDTQRWFHVVLTLDRIGTSLAQAGLSGRNHLDIAVSATASPLGTWNIYKLPVQNDGTEGTPNHHCSPGPPTTPPPTNPTACIGDYPHIGADKHGIYITTNEYSFFGPEFTSAQVYAISKRALAAGAAAPAVVQFANTVVEKAGTPGFTVWPAISPAGQYATSDGGTEFFLSSMAAEEAGNFTGLDNRIGLWAITNTQSLDSPRPNLTLSSRSLDSLTYAVPPKANQKAGNVPLAQCINDTTLPTPFGPGCWQFFFLPEDEPGHNEVEGPLDAIDSRMQQVYYANGLVWGALGTAVSVGGVEKAGIAYVVVKPVVIGNGQHVGPQSAIVKQGYVAAANNNVLFPAVAVLPNGRGVMAFTLAGGDYYPSAAYALIDAVSGVGDLRVAAPGLGPQDGFTEYRAFASNPERPRPRWGDYGAAVTDGNAIWIASEYIGQTCTFAQYVAAPFGSCGGTRASLGNWYTRISKVTP